MVSHRAAILFNKSLSANQGKVLNDKLELSHLARGSYNGDIDTLFIPGTYWCIPGYSGTKATGASYGLLIVESYSGLDGVFQKFIPFTATGSIDPFYERWRINNVWSPWRAVVNTNCANGHTRFCGTYKSTAANRYNNGAIEIRENDLVTNTKSDIGYAPTIGFHWGSVAAGMIVLSSDNKFRFLNQDGTTVKEIYARIMSKNSYQIVDTDDHTYNIIAAYGDGNGWGTQLVIGGGGNLFIGGGESASSLYNNFQTPSNIKTNEYYSKSSEETYITSDNNMWFYVNTNTFANRIGIKFGADGILEPVTGSTINFGKQGNHFDTEYVNRIYIGKPKTVSKNNGTNYSCDHSISMNYDGDVEFVPSQEAQPYPTRINSMKLEACYLYCYELVVSSNVKSSLIPYNTNVYTLGSSNTRWKEIWCNTSLNTTSDRNLKKDIKDMIEDERYFKFFMMLQGKRQILRSPTQ